MAKNATCLVKTIILINLILLTASNTSRSAGTPEQRRACEEDAFKFCRKVIPDVPPHHRMHAQKSKKPEPALSARYLRNSVQLSVFALSSVFSTKSFLDNESQKEI
jgi:hypothetical protein